MPASFVQLHRIDFFTSYTFAFTMILRQLQPLHQARVLCKFSKSVPDPYDVLGQTDAEKKAQKKAKKAAAKVQEETKKSKFPVPSVY